MTDPTAGPDQPDHNHHINDNDEPRCQQPGRDDEPDLDGPDVDEPLTVERILAAAGAPEALDGLPARESQASQLVSYANARDVLRLAYELVTGPSHAS